MTLAILLVSALLPLPAQASSGCSGAPVIQDVCIAPGPATAPGVTVQSPCAACIFPADIALPHRRGTLTCLGFPIPVQPTCGLVPKPDHRPPRA